MFNIKTHVPGTCSTKSIFLEFYFIVLQKTKYSTENARFMKLKLSTWILCFTNYMLLPIYMSMYYICTNISRIPLLPLSVRLKHPSLSPDRESAPHCRTIALGWYISITLVITYSVIHSTSDSYAKLKKIPGSTLYWNLYFVFKHSTFQF